MGSKIGQAEKRRLTFSNGFAARKNTVLRVKFVCDCIRGIRK